MPRLRAAEVEYLLCLECGRAYLVDTSCPDCGMRPSVNTRRSTKRLLVTVDCLPTTYARQARSKCGQCRELYVPPAPCPFCANEIAPGRPTWVFVPTRAIGIPADTLDRLRPDQLDTRSFGGHYDDPAGDELKVDKLKVDNLIDALTKAGFAMERSSESRRHLVHPLGPKAISIDGKLTDVAKNYQVSAMQGIISEIAQHGVAPNEVGAEDASQAPINLADLIEVNWSKDERIFVGTAPTVMYGGCHGESEDDVRCEISAVLDEIIDLYRHHGKPIPRSQP